MTPFQAADMVLPSGNDSRAQEWSFGAWGNLTQILRKLGGRAVKGHPGCGPQRPGMDPGTTS